jgi:hypothetical protein
MAKTTSAIAVCANMLAVALLSTTLLTACTDNLPASLRADLDAPKLVDGKYPAFNASSNDPVIYVKLDKDVLRPTRQSQTRLPFTEKVGPYELREETLAGALELILADKKIPMAFETNKATSNTITITGLQGPLNDVVDKVCGLANLYCAYENGTLLVREEETFTVSLPPMIAEDYSPFVNGLQAIAGGKTYVDSVTRSLIYTATQRNQQNAIDYFDRLRTNTALIVYEIQIWEVQLSDQRQTGIDWEEFSGTLGNFNIDLTRDGAPSISGALGLGAQYTATDISADAVLSFLQTQGAVKTVSQPQLTVLSGSKAKLRVGNKRDYVSQITRTVGVNTADNVSVATSKLETGLNFEINSAWDNGTVYGDLKIDLQNLIRLGSLDVGTTSIQLPETSDRSIETKIRVRPGDAVIIGGIVEERSTMDQEGPPGLSKPLFATSKDKQATNTELVFMLKPRVVVYTEKMPTTASLNDAAFVAEPFREPHETFVLPREPEDEMQEAPLVETPPAVKAEPLPLVKSSNTSKPVAKVTQAVTETPSQIIPNKKKP